MVLFPFLSFWLYCVIQIYLEKKIENVMQILNTFLFLIEKQCPILRTEERQFIQDNRDKLEVSGKRYNSLQRSIWVKLSPNMWYIVGDSWTV